jgi:hypothetical protein
MIDRSNDEPMEQFDGEDDDAPEVKTRSSQAIRSAIKKAEKAFDRYNTKADRIDKLYSSLQTWAGYSQFDSDVFDREFNLFWASVEVIKPSIYSRPPVPVVTPKFKDRVPVKRVTAEMLERCTVVGFDISDIDQVMLGIRDDLAINARGVMWLTYETKADSDLDSERVCIEHLDRNDFLHEPVREWAEVGWVARRAWLTKKEARKRFRKTSGDAYQQAEYSVRREDKENGGDDGARKAGFWEVWHKDDNRVYWVEPTVDVFLDEGEPHLKLKSYFPCPRPAYATLQRRSLVPVPDISYIEDQLEQINELTSRIHGLVGNLQVKGLYPAGGDVGDAVEMALKMDSDQIMVPVPAAILSTAQAGRDLVQWIPITEVAQTIIAAIEARRELIGNVQELLGVADIMRGETEAQETFGAQKLKAQFGSVRIRDKVNELVRIARDAVNIMADIMATEFSFDTLLEMSQMEIPTKSEIQKQLDSIKQTARKELEALAKQAEEAMANPQMAQQAEQDPQAAQAKLQEAQQGIIQKYQPQIQKLGQAVTVEDVKELLESQKTRAFVFDIETDSTIYPDEQAEKEARNEFMTAFVTATQSLAALAMSGPAGAKMAGGLIKFQLGPYRAGRELEGLVDEWVDSMTNAQPQPNPEVLKAQAEQQYKMQQLALEDKKFQGDQQFKGQELQLRSRELDIREQEIAQKPQIEAGKAQIKAQADAQAQQLDAEGAVIKNQAELDADAQTTQMALDAEAQLEAQRASDAMAQKLVDDAFRRDELAVDTQLAYDQLDATRETARMNAEAKAKQPKGPNNA